MTVIKIKNSNVTGRVPQAGDIEVAELALNLQDKKLYSKDAAGSIFEIGAAGDIPSGPNPPNAGNNVGDLFWDQTDGALKYWDGAKWETIATEPADGEGYVKVSGDNMTGNLTLDTNKITLNATDGSATFAGNVTSNDKFIASGPNTTDMRFQVYQTDTNKTITRINGDGSASFSGDITLNAPGIGQIILYNEGYIQTYRGTTNTDDLLLELRSNVGGAAAAQMAVSSDGSATFSGVVTTSGNPVGGGETGAVMYNGFAAARPDGGNYIWTGFKTGTSTPTSYIQADGNATFAAKVTSASTEASDSGGTLVTKDYLDGTGSSGSGFVNIAGDNMTGNLTLDTNKITLNATDGSANFAGVITTSGSPVSGGETGSLMYEGFLSARPLDGNYLWNGFKTGTSTPTSYIQANGDAFFAGNIAADNVVFSLETDNDANYVTTTDVDEEGNTVETRVYNGPTLDVKEKLMEAMATIEDLKTRLAALEGAA